LWLCLQLSQLAADGSHTLRHRHSTVLPDHAVVHVEMQEKGLASVTSL
jgi:hypothetical protein